MVVAFQGEEANHAAIMVLEVLEVTVDRFQDHCVFTSGVDGLLLE